MCYLEPVGCVCDMPAKKEIKIKEISEISEILKEFRKENSETLDLLNRRIETLEKKGDRRHPKQSADPEEKFKFSASAQCITDDERSSESDSERRPRVKSTQRVPTETSPHPRTNQLSGFASIQSEDLQAKYSAIRESVNRQRLPKDLKFNGSIKGLKANVRDTVKAWSTTGKFIVLVSSHRESVSKNSLSFHETSHKISHSSHSSHLLLVSSHRP